MNYKLDVNEIKAHLKNNVDVLIFDTLHSTNNTAKELLFSGAPNGMAIIADGLTGARGRQGKAFFAPKGGVYFSVILNLNNSPELITVIAAVAVCEAIEKTTNLTPKIKWVNDIFLHGKKVCGILAEAIPNGIILGIGINFNATNFPAELNETATSLFVNEPPSVTRNKLIAEILNGIFENDSCENTLKKYKSRLFILGRQITFEYCGSLKTATALDIDNKGRLTVRLKSGEILTLEAGEIKLVKQG